MGEVDVRGIVAGVDALDAYLEALGTCGDGHCIVLRPIGMHTNGGCRCSRDSLKMQRYAYAMNRFALAIRQALQEGAHDDR